MSDVLVQLKYNRWFAGGAGAAVLLLALLFGGCGASEPATVAGRITDTQGRPVSWGTVTAVGADNQVYTAPIQSDGSYELRGLPAGVTYKFAVSSPNPQPPAVKGLPEPKGGSGGSGGGTVAGRGRSSATPGGGSGGSRPGGGGTDRPKDSEVQAFGINGPPLIAPPPVAAPRNAPPADKWFPIAGRYANPQTSGLSAQAGSGRTTQNLTLP